MKITCYLSGVSFRTEFFQKFELGAKHKICHPVFNLQTRELLVRCKDWRQEKFSQQEQKLFFLALLHKTNAVIWNTSPEPTLACIARNFVPLLKLVGAADILENTMIQLPRYAITEETKDLQNLHNWIYEWNCCKEDYLKPLSRNYIRKQSAQTELALDRLLASPFKKLEQLAPRLYSWTMMQLPALSKSEKEDRKKWFFLSEKELFALPNWQVRELEEFLHLLEIELYSSVHYQRSADPEEETYETVREGHYGSNYSDAVLRLLRGKLAKAKGGLIGDLGGAYYHILSDDLDDVEAPERSMGTTEEKRSKLIISANTVKDLDKKRKLAAIAPETEPKPSNFSSVAEFIRAKAAWNALVSLRKAGMDVVSS